MTLCNAPIRDVTASVTQSGLIGGGLALLIFGLRMCSLLGSKGRAAGWDDYTIAVAMAFAIPMAVFAPFRE
jgi:hypothetical protein